MPMAHLTGERGASGRSRSRRAAFCQTAGREVWRPGSDDRDQDPLPDPAQDLPGGYLTPLSSESVSVSTGQADRWRTRKSSSQKSPGLSLSEVNAERWFCRESLSLCSRGSCSVGWRGSGERSESSNQQDSCRDRSLSSSHRLEGLLCPPLPGQVPVEPTETSNGRTAQGAMEAPPVNKSSTGSRKKGKGRFLYRLWKAVKRVFCCCWHCSAVTVVEPFVPPAEPDPDPSSPAPDHYGIKANNESFKSTYAVIKLIGSGGFGRVYQGERRFDGKKVAIKRIRKIDNNRYLNIPGHPEPLVTEVALMLMMRREPISPFVIQLYEWFENPTGFTLVMEYPEPCESLDDFIAQNYQMHEPTARFIMRQAVLAVQHCIRQGVFHHDIHAQNFMLQRYPVQLKLIDFGCGQLLSRDGYESNIYVGAPNYCPPEVLTEPRFHAVPANVWSLGVLLYKMMNQCTPFHNRRKIIEAEVTFLNPYVSKSE